MKPGRKPKPSVIRELEGNREHRTIPDVLKPDVIDELEVPKWIRSRNASKLWRNIAKKEYVKMGTKLREMGLLTELDHAAFERYVTAYAKWVVAEAMAEIAVSKMSSGQYQPHPYINIALKYANEMKKYIEMFGMSPSARMRIDVSLIPGYNDEDEEDFD